MAQYDLIIHVENATGGYDEIPAGQATTSDLDTGTAQDRIVTPKGLKDAEFQRIHIGTSAPADTTKLWLDTN